MAAQATRTLKLKFDGDSTGLASASKDASATLERVGKSADKSSKGLKKAAERSEGLADNSSLATGALGALASGFELVGLEKYSGRLQQAALATDFLSGVGDTLTLVTDRLGLAKAAVAIKTGVLTAATYAQAAAQRVLNLAMKANPTVLVLTAIVAALVLAYTKSDKFREIVNKAFAKVKEAVSAVWEWIRKHWPLLLAILTGPIGLAVRAITRHWDKIKDGISDVIAWVRGMPGRLLNLGSKFASAGKSIIGSFVDGLKNAAGVISGITGNVWNALKTMINAGIDKINDALEFKISLPGPDIHVNPPNIGHLAAGGYGAPGRWYLTGEYGPELVRFGPGGGQVTPNNRLEGGGLTGADVRTLAGAVLELIAELMRGQIREHDRGLVRRAGAA